MTVFDIKKKLQQSEYDFLREHPKLGNNIILLGIGGSYAYGTNNQFSDIDLRGIATRAKNDILTNQDFEQVSDSVTDSCIYSFDKIVRLLCSCNPNTIEILGLKPEHYLYVAPAGKILLENKHVFLSRAAIHSFGGYAKDQLRRLENKAARVASQSQQEINILKSIQHADVDFKRKYFDRPEDSISLYIDNSSRDGYDTEIFADISLTHYPLRDFKDVVSDMNAIIKAYSKIGKRNKYAVEHDKIGKHMMHCVRLFYMCFDILEKGEIITYRESEHDLLMDIRNGKYLDENSQPTTEFYEMVEELERRFDYAKENTDLPERVDIGLVSNLLAQVNIMTFLKGEN